VAICKQLGAQKDSLMIFPEISEAGEAAEDYNSQPRTA